jgi:hypothetical protein
MGSEPHYPYVFQVDICARDALRYIWQMTDNLSFKWKIK